MWTLLLLLSTLSGGSFALPGAGSEGDGVSPAQEAVARSLVGGAPSIQLPIGWGPAGRTLDDGGVRWAGDTWPQRTVRRRRVSRTLRLKVDARPPRSVRSAERDARRHSATVAAIRIRRSAAVARAVAHAALQAHAPARIGPSETYPPAA